MRASVPAFLAMSILLAAGLSAQEAPSATPPESTSPSLAERDEETSKRDYSREALLSAFWLDPDYRDDVPRAPEPFNPLQFMLFGQTFRFNPFFAAPGMGGVSATPFDVVDPFALAPVSTAYTPLTFRDRWGDWKMERQLKKGKK